MSFNSVFGWFIKQRLHQMELFMKYPAELQHELQQRLVDEAALTCFGLQHRFSKFRSVDDFRKDVPIRKYEDFKPYIDQLRDREQNVLWLS